MSASEIIMAAAGASGPANYIEDVFSTYLYTGNGTGQTINNNIDLSGKGGLVWIKSRSNAVSHALMDTARGRASYIASNSTSAAQTEASTDGLTSFNSNGFTLGVPGAAYVNDNGYTFASWTFRKQPKFFDVVTYTGNGASNRAISHSLGSTPGCVIVKRVSAAENWIVWHRSISAANKMLVLNSTAAQTGSLIAFDNSLFTSTTFGVNNDTSSNNNGDTYVAYLFAHDAGGFGLTGTDNVISCGSYVGNGSATGPVITLGWEPQWLLIKNANVGWNWKIVDVMRGAAVTSTVDLEPNNSSGENAPGVTVYPTATGFQVATTSGTWNGNGNTIIYIAIRRGPMKVPTDATKVFAPVTYSGNGSVNREVSIGLAADLAITKNRGAVYGPIRDRLRGNGVFLVPSSTDGDTATNNYGFNGPNQNSLYTAETGGAWNASANTYVVETFKRAPSFLDVVCYSGTGANQTLSHNLQAVPELIICKSRTLGSASYNWSVTFNFGASSFKEMYLNAQNAATNYTPYNTVISAQPSSTTFSVGSSPRTGASANNYVAYLFATCAGVSKVGTYTGTGATQTINCGFTGGARFVLIKRTDSTGDWYYWDTARGISSGNDPYLVLNSDAAEVTTNNYVDTDSTGFKVVTNLNALNASGGTFIFLAIA